MEEDAVSGSRPAISGPLAFKVHLPYRVHGSSAAGQIYGRRESADSRGTRGMELQENELDHEVVWIFDHYLFHEGIQR